MQENSNELAVVAEAPVAVVLTEAQLMAELEAALKSKDFKAVATASRKLDTAVKAKEKEELALKRLILDAQADKVKVAITKAIKGIIESGELDAADGIWYSYDFGDEAPTLRLMKTAARAASKTGSSGGGKKFDISTVAMLEKYGQEEYKDGMTFQQAHESSTDKNWRFAIRLKLLKKEGII